MISAAYTYIPPRKIIADENVAAQYLIFPTCEERSHTRSIVNGMTEPSALKRKCYTAYVERIYFLHEVSSIENDRVLKIVLQN